MHCDMLIGSCCENLGVRRVVVCAALQGGACRCHVDPGQSLAVPVELTRLTRC
jgi:hypothetical protein